MAEKPRTFKDGWVPSSKGWTPSSVTNKPAVQGGYTPATGKIAAPPPTGGSGVKPPKQK